MHAGRPVSLTAIAPPALALEHVTKRFGSRTAVDAIDLEVPVGSCFGLLGPNAAGKTTLVRVALGLAAPSSGRVLIDGRDVATDRRAALAGVGGIVEEPRHWPLLTGRENLTAYAAVLGEGARERVDPALATVGLADRARDRVKGYSLGMRQRLGLARALLSDPKLLVLDEPSNGLDPTGMSELRALLQRLTRDEGRTVVVSSHLLDEVQRTCDHVAVLDRGRVLHVGRVADLLAGDGLVVEVDDVPRALEILRRVDGVAGAEVVRDERSDRTAFTGTIRTRGNGDSATALAVSRALAADGVGIAGLRPGTATLEESYLALTRERAAGVGGDLRRLAP